MDKLEKVVEYLKNGGVVICPTDTVYGFLADAQNKKAVENIYWLKNRPLAKPLSVFVKDIAMAESLGVIDKKQVRVLQKYWPGKYTFIVKRKFDMRLFGLEKETIAMRIPKNTFLQKLLRKLNRPLVQTSVNISNEKPLESVKEIQKIFGKEKVLIVPGRARKNAKPSKIIDLTKNKIIRK